MVHQSHQINFTETILCVNVFAKPRNLTRDTMVERRKCFRFTNGAELKNWVHGYLVAPDLSLEKAPMIRGT